MEVADHVAVALGRAPLWRIAPKDFKEVPPRVEYALTAFGESLWTALTPLCEWGALHMQRIEACKEALEAKVREKAVAQPGALGS
jgi:hypothetical protein